ncbi:MAG TPA: hypothetical protein VNE62_06840 [Actinomycetota bacterium]|nr:hypothetical protein [Actinomycetota bacterium]
MAQMSARLGVKDLERELKFYSSLGFEVERSGAAARVSFGDTVLTVQSYDTLRVADRPLLDWEQNPSQFGTGIQFYLMVDNVDDVVGRIPIGVARPWPVQDKPWGLRELTLRTPSGYLLTFAQPIGR